MNQFEGFCPRCKHLVVAGEGRLDGKNKEGRWIVVHHPCFHYWGSTQTPVQTSLDLDGKDRRATLEEIHALKVKHGLA